MAVLDAAPSVLQGARKLWRGVKHEKIPPAASRHLGDRATTQAALKDIDGRIAEVESQIVKLERELASSSKVIESLAEQNLHLVQAVEVLRVRTRILFSLTAIAGFAAIVLALWLLTR